MRRPPRSRQDRIIDREMQIGVLFVGLTMAAATLLTLDLKLPGGLIEGSSSLREGRTAAFTVLVFAQLFNCFNSRSERASAFTGLLSSPLLWGAVALSAGLQVLVVCLPALNAAFGTTPLALSDWLLCLVMASAVLWLDELKKLVVRGLLRPVEVPAAASAAQRVARPSGTGTSS